MEDEKGFCFILFQNSSRAIADNGSLQKKKIDQQELLDSRRFRTIFANFLFKVILLKKENEY